MHFCPILKKLLTRKFLFSLSIIFVKLQSIIPGKSFRRPFLNQSIIKNHIKMTFKNSIFILTSLSLLVISCTCGHVVNNGAGQTEYVAPGIGLGSVIAVVVSWSRNKSILWAIIHGLLGWLYVIYALLVKAK